jgi:hypothetical protein
LQIKPYSPGTQLKFAERWRVENENGRKSGVSDQRRILITQGVNGQQNTIWRANVDGR